MLLHDIINQIIIELAIYTVHCLLFASYLEGIVLVEGLLFMHFYGVCTQSFISFIFKLFAEYFFTFLL